MWFWCVLTAWPVALFFFGRSDVLVELAGLRGNVMLLPFLLLGARLTDQDLPPIVRTLAWLNIAAFVVAGAVAGSLARPADAMLDSKLRGGDAAIIVTELTTYTPTGMPTSTPTTPPSGSPTSLPTTLPTPAPGAPVS